MVAEGITPEAAWEKLRAPQRKLPVVHETVAVSLVTSAPKKWSMDELRSAVERSSDPEELLQFAKIADQHDWSRLYTTAINKAMKMA